MRLWHERLIPCLPNSQLLGQHRECCALRGNAWGRKHSTVDYVFNHEPDYLYKYHYMVMIEMSKRGFQIAQEWKNPLYRGRNCTPYDSNAYDHFDLKNVSVYPEHDENYLHECLENLARKGIIIELAQG